MRISPKSTVGSAKACGSADLFGSARLVEQALGYHGQTDIVVDGTLVRSAAATCRTYSAGDGAALLAGQPVPQLSSPLRLGRRAAPLFTTASRLVSRSITLI
jgi:hypothetical protein